MTSKFDNLVPEAGLLETVRAMYAPKPEELNEGSPNLGPEISYTLARANRAKDKKYSPKFAKERAEYEKKMHAANKKLGGPNAAPLHFASGSNYNQQEETELEIAQAINELSADTLRSYAKQAQGQVDAKMPRGRQPAALKKTLEKRQAGLDIVGKKSRREFNKRAAARDANHSAMLKDLHSKIPDLIKSHGYTKVHSADLPSGTKATMYQKAHEGAAVITHVTHFQRADDNDYRPVVKFSGSGNVSSSSDDYRINKLFGDETPSATPSADEHLKNISAELKGAERRHASYSMNEGSGAEDVEQIDELSKATLGSYIKKASTSAASKAVEYGTKKTERDEVDRMTNRHMRYDDKEKIHKALNTTSSDVEAPRRKAAKRLGGINRAVTKLTKEDVGLDEEQVKRGRGRPKKNPEPGEDTQEGPEALGYQLRKARSIGKPVTFLDGSQHKVEHKHGVLFDIHMDHRKTSKEKQEFQNAAHASHADFVKQVTAPLPTTHEGGGTGEIMRYSTSNDRFGRHQRY